MTNWMSPVNKLTLREAFLANAKTVTLDDGRKFKLTYKDDYVRVNPVSGFFPMGSFHLPSVKQYIWVERK